MLLFMGKIGVSRYRQNLGVDHVQLILDLHLGALQRHDLIPDLVGMELRDLRLHIYDLTMQLHDLDVQCFVAYLHII